MKKRAAPTATPASPVLTSSEAATLAGVRPRTIVRWVKAGRVAGRKAGPGLRSAVLVERASLEAYLSAREEQPGQPAS